MMFSPELEVAIYQSMTPEQQQELRDNFMKLSALNLKMQQAVLDYQIKQGPPPPEEGGN